ncbi:MAG: ribonuclease III [Clostridia bacterium]|nr:ribonuclease III [Clostridia bacterium]
MSVLKGLSFTQFPIEQLEEKIGYCFRDKGLLQEAFTHSTYANAYGGKDNERLEYLGDAVLQMVVTEWQYARDKKATEGDLTQERQKIVCEQALDEAVRAMGIAKYLLMEGSRANVGRKTVSSLFETVTAAIYLDGGYEAAKKFVLTYGCLEEKTQTNPKGDLQEFLQKKGEALPTYRIQKTGKDNAPIFYCEAQAMGEKAQGSGKSKREAEQDAAEKLLQALRKKTR